jgi:protoporphyrinogen IX oxidase
MLYVKALHIIFIVTWFAGLFYMPRLFIYHIEASSKPEPEKTILTEQLKIMQKRLWYGITWPSMILTVIFGVWLTFLFNAWAMKWLLIKLGLVVGLILYHLLCHKIFLDLKNNKIKYTSAGMRMWNEVATIFLVTIVFIVVLKNSINFLFASSGFIVLLLLLYFGIKLYKKYRQD